MQLKVVLRQEHAWTIQTQLNVVNVTFPHNCSLCCFSAVYGIFLIENSVLDYIDKILFKIWISASCLFLGEILKNFEKFLF